MNNKGLPNGFITVEEAIELINKDDRDNATVDTDFMIAGLPYLRLGGNFNIRLMRTDPKLGAVYAGEKYVYIESEYQSAILEHAIVEHYKKATGNIGFSLDKNTRSLSTAVDDEENPQAMIIPQKKPMTKAGDDIESHAVTKTNGAE